MNILKAIMKDKLLYPSKPCISLHLSASFMPFSFLLSNSLTFSSIRWSSSICGSSLSSRVWLWLVSIIVPLSLPWGAVSSTGFFVFLFYIEHKDCQSIWSIWIFNLYNSYGLPIHRIIRIPNPYFFLIFNLLCILTLFVLSNWVD